MKYFAYGSNMSRARMQERLKRSVTGTVATLRGYRVAFNKPMATDPTHAYANIVADARESVAGVVYDCTEADLIALDGFEGVHAGQYRRSEVTVHCEGRPEAAVAYVGCIESDAPSLPSTQAYLDLILAGAIENGLGRDVLARLQQASGIAPSGPSAR